MFGLGLTETLFALILGAILLIQYAKPKKNLPPGPRGLPLVGNIFQLTVDGHLKMAEWAKQYGKMYAMQMGLNTCIVLNDAKLVKEVLSDANFTIRPHMPILEQLSGGHGIISTNGVEWEEQRRWSLRKLRDFGFGKTSMEGLIMDEVAEVIDYFRKSKGEYISIKSVFDLAAFNSLWTLLNGERLSQHDPKIRAVLNTLHQLAPAVAQNGLIFAPWLKYILPKSQKRIDDISDTLMGYARETVAEHFASYKEGESRDFIDEYITEIKKTTNPNSSFYKDAGKVNLEGTISDFIQAGSETTSNTLNWMLNYLCQHPEIQDKMQNELDAVVGTSRPVALSDKPQLTYTEAVILETLRKSALVASGVQHSAIVDKEVNGYTIPKGCWIMTNIYFVHHDPKVWGDPENYRPERFLSPDGKKVVRHESLIPFQIGRRQCLGESLARDSLFLFTSNIFQQFKITKLEKEEPKPIAGLFLVSKEYHFRFESRIK